MKIFLFQLIIYIFFFYCLYWHVLVKMLNEHRSRVRQTAGHSTVLHGINMDWVLPEQIPFRCNEGHAPYGNHLHSRNLSHPVLLLSKHLSGRDIWLKHKTTIKANAHNKLNTWTIVKKKKNLFKNNQLGN